MWRWFVSMMDVPEMLDRLGDHMQQRRLSRGGALIILVCCMAAFGPLAYLYWRFDLASTWDWFDWLVSGGQDEVQRAISDPNTAAAAVMMFGFGVTMFPSAVQLGFARFINIPALGILIKATIAFDLGTDWDPVWQAAQGATWYDATFTWPPMAAFARFVGTCLGTALVSVVLQSIVLMVLAVGVYCALILLLGKIPDPIAPRMARQDVVYAR